MIIANPICVHNRKYKKIQRFVQIQKFDMNNGNPVELSRVWSEMNIEKLYSIIRADCCLMPADCWPKLNISDVNIEDLSRERARRRGDPFSWWQQHWRNLYLIFNPSELEIKLIKLLNISARFLFSWGWFVMFCFWHEILISFEI